MLQLTVNVEEVEVAAEFLVLAVFQRLKSAVLKLFFFVNDVDAK
jgi:hypothetical protein